MSRPPRWTPLPAEVWEYSILPRLPKPLAVEEAVIDLNHLARNGKVPGKRTLAGRWGWLGDAGAERAARLVKDREGWADPQLRRLLG